MVYQELFVGITGSGVRKKAENGGASALLVVRFLMSFHQTLYPFRLGTSARY